MSDQPSGKVSAQEPASAHLKTVLINTVVPSHFCQDYRGTDQEFSSSNEHLESNTTRVFFIVSFPRIDSKPSPSLSRSSKTRCDSRSP